MAESSTEDGAPNPEQGDEQRKVPVAAVAKERAEKRAARDEVQKLTEELETTRKAAAISAEDQARFAEELGAEARRAVEAELAPYRSAVAKYKMAMQLGLNESQADKLMEIKTKNPGLTDQQALLLARADHQDLFPSGESRSPFTRVHGGLPVSGNPESRMGNDQPNFVEKMNEARKAGDIAGAQRFAQEEALNRFRKAFTSRPIR